MLMESVKPLHLLKTVSGPAASLQEIAEAMASNPSWQGGLSSLSSDLAPIKDVLALDKRNLKLLAKTIEKLDSDSLLTDDSQLTPLRTRFVRLQSCKSIIERAKVFLAQHSSALRSQLQGDALATLVNSLESAVQDLFACDTNTQDNDAEGRLQKIAAGMDKLLEKLHKEPAHIGSLSIFSSLNDKNSSSHCHCPWTLGHGPWWCKAGVIGPSLLLPVPLPTGITAPPTPCNLDGGAYMSGCTCRYDFHVIAHNRRAPVEQRLQSLPNHLPLIPSPLPSWAASSPWRDPPSYCTI